MFFFLNRLVRTSVQEDLASPNRTNWLNSIIARERNEEVMAVKGKNFRDDAISIAGANRLQIAVCGKTNYKAHSTHQKWLV